MIGLLVDFDHFDASLRLHIGNLGGVVVEYRETNPSTQAVGTTEVQIDGLSAIDHLGDLALNVLEVLALDFFKLLAQKFVLASQIIPLLGQLIDFA